MDWVEVLLATCCAIVFGLFVWATYNEAVAPTFALKKEDWSCTDSHVETWTELINTGGKAMVLVPITHTDTVCDKWERRK